MQSRNSNDSLMLMKFQIVLEMLHFVSLCIQALELRLWKTYAIGLLNVQKFDFSDYWIFRTQRLKQHFFRWIVWIRLISRKVNVQHIRSSFSAMGHPSKKNPHHFISLKYCNHNLPIELNITNTHTNHHQSWNTLILLYY